MDSKPTSRNRLLLHDPNVHPEPHIFNPERFIATENKPAERDPRESVFGFGRRACPGRHVADATVFLAVSSVLATLHISRVIEDGKEVVPVHESSSGGIWSVFTVAKCLYALSGLNTRDYIASSHPLPFKCNIRPRSNKASQLIFDERVE